MNQQKIRRFDLNCYSTDIAIVLLLVRETLQIQTVASSVLHQQYEIWSVFVFFNKFCKILGLVVVFSWIVYSWTLDTAHGLTRGIWVVTWLVRWQAL